MKPIALFIALTILGLFGIGGPVYFIGETVCIGELQKKPLNSSEPNGQRDERQGAKQQQRTPATNKHAARNIFIAFNAAHAADETPEATPNNQGKSWYSREPWKKFLCEMKWGDVALIFFTYMLVVVGSFQAFYLWHTVLVTKEAAEALPKLERAYVFVEIRAGVLEAVLTKKKEDTMFAIKHLSVDIRIINRGKTPAIINDVSIGLADFADVPKPEDLPIERLKDIHKDKVLAANDDIGPYPVFHKKEFDVAMFDRFGGGYKVCVFGHVAYQDVLGDSQTTEFCWSLDRNMDHMAPYGGQKYNRRT